MEGGTVRHAKVREIAHYLDLDSLIVDLTTYNKKKKNLKKGKEKYIGSLTYPKSQRYRIARATYDSSYFIYFFL